MPVASYRLAMGCIYKIINEVNGKVYIGKTTRSVKIRFEEHISEALSGRENYKLHNAIRKYGVDKFRYIVLCESNNDEVLNKLEIFFIEKNENGYNMTIGGDGLRSGKYHPNHGRCRPDLVEHMRKIALFNNPMKNPEVIAKISGKNHLYHRNKNVRRASKTNIKKQQKACRVKIAKIDLDTGKILDNYESIAEAIRNNEGDIQGCLSGYQKTAGGFGWKKT